MWFEFGNYDETLRSLSEMPSHFENGEALEISCLAYRTLERWSELENAAEAGHAITGRIEFLYHLVWAALKQRDRRKAARLLEEAPTGKVDNDPEYYFLCMCALCQMGLTHAAKSFFFKAVKLDRWSVEMNLRSLDEPFLKPLDETNPASWDYVP